jgi:hypothetical protein
MYALLLLVLRYPGHPGSIYAGIRTALVTKAAKHQAPSTGTTAAILSSDHFTRFHTAQSATTA